MLDFLGLLAKKKIFAAFLLVLAIVAEGAIAFFLAKPSILAAGTILMAAFLVYLFQNINRS